MPRIFYYKKTDYFSCLITKTLLSIKIFVFIPMLNILDSLFFSSFFNQN